MARRAAIEEKLTIDLPPSGNGSVSIASPNTRTGRSVPSRFNLTTSSRASLESSKNELRADGGRRDVAARRIDEDVDPAPTLERGVARGPQLCLVEHVGNKRICVASTASQLRRERLGALGRAGENRRRLRPPP